MLIVTNLATFHCSHCQFILVKLLLKRQATQDRQTDRHTDRQTVAICDTGSLMNSNRKNIVSINYCLHFEGEGPRGSPGPPPLLDEVIFKI